MPGMGEPVYVTRLLANSLDLGHGTVRNAAGSFTTRPPRDRPTASVSELEDLRQRISELEARLKERVR
jgi:hypothetical protein